MIGNSTKSPRLTYDRTGAEGTLEVPDINLHTAPDRTPG